MKTQRTSIVISFVFGLGVAACQGTLHTGMEGQGGSTGNLRTGGIATGGIIGGTGGNPTGGIGSGGHSGGTAGQSATGATTAGGVAGATVGGAGGTSGSNSCGTHDQFGPRLAVRTIGSAGGDPYDGPAIVEGSTSQEIRLYFVLTGATGGTGGTGPDGGLPASNQEIHVSITGLDPMPLLTPGAKLWLSKNPAGNQESEVLMYGIAPWSLSARNRQGGDLLFGAARNQFDAAASPVRIGVVTPDCTALDVDPYSCTPGASTTYSSVEVEGDTPVVIHDSVPGTVTLGGIEYDVRATVQKLSSAAVVCMDHHDSDYSGVALDIRAKNLADLVAGSTGGLGTGGTGAGGIIAGTGGNPDGGMGTGGITGSGGSGGSAGASGSTATASGGSPADAPPAEVWKVTISVNSGLPDPVFSLEPSEVAEVRARLDSAPWVRPMASADETIIPARLDYRGMYVKASAGDRVIEDTEISEGTILRRTTGAVYDGKSVNLEGYLLSLAVAKGTISQGLADQIKSDSNGSIP